MERHIVEILVLLMREYPDGNIQPEDFEPLTNDLFGQGYTQMEIETALVWYNSRLELKEASQMEKNNLPPSIPSVT
ncbi:DUF494 family protein [Calditrichota bacterium]